MSIQWKSVKDYPLGKIIKETNSGGERSIAFQLFAGYDAVRLFAVSLADGGYDCFVGYIDDGGSICTQDSGDDVGWTWEDVSHWAEFSTPNAQSCGTE